MDVPNTLSVTPRTHLDAQAEDAADDGIDASVAPRPRTGTVLALLVTAALVLSYVVAYPLTNALRAAEVLAPPPAAGYDPRLRWMAVTFVSVLSAFAVAAGAFRLLNRRQMRRIDEMLETE